MYKTLQLSKEIVDKANELKDKTGITLKHQFETGWRLYERKLKMETLKT